MRGARRYRPRPAPPGDALERTGDPRVRLVLADSQHLVRHALRCFLDSLERYTVVAETARSVKLANLVLRVRPDVLLVDFEMSPLNGADVARTMRAQVPETPVVVISRYVSDVHVVECLRKGASAYVTKAAPPHELPEAIDAARQGRKYVSSPLSRRPLRYWLERATRGVADTYETLSAREREVLQLVSQGLSGSVVSRRLGISARTVETHRERLKEKLGVPNTAGLIRYTIERQMSGLAGER